MTAKCQARMLTVVAVFGAVAWVAVRGAAEALSDDDATDETVADDADTESNEDDAMLLFGAAAAAFVIYMWWVQIFFNMRDVKSYAVLPVPYLLVTEPLRLRVPHGPHSARSPALHLERERRHHH